MKSSFTVPAGMGYLIGNTLRQFAMKGTSSWQVAAYKIPRVGSFGISPETPSTYLSLLKGKLYTTETKNSCAYDCVLKEFTLSGDDYVCDDMVIKNIGFLGLPRVEVCLVYASDARTAEENYISVKEICGSNVSDFISIPSRHNPTITFKYTVDPISREKEILSIEATPGSVDGAINIAMEALQALHINN